MFIYYASMCVCVYGWETIQKDLMFSIPKCSTHIYNKQQCSVKHDIHLINIFNDLGPKVNK